MQRDCQKHCNLPMYAPVGCLTHPPGSLTVVSNLQDPDICIAVCMWLSSTRYAKIKEPRSAPVCTLEGQGQRWRVGVPRGMRKHDSIGRWVPRKSELGLACSRPADPILQLQQTSCRFFCCCGPASAPQIPCLSRSRRRPAQQQQRRPQP
ncbi:hypothetical protein BT67DRAFT_164407 [Trichocladium antarcticum]|uniref:Uncharacterized protein n=1 Tax=Trichocladium antarcticum TaxID=1450529 RepID=A0AAN6UEI5_9PEZI|nr:hypothetical protein BT67DRAFT_164407 [Trichocladium antarcticum]